MLLPLTSPADCAKELSERDPHKGLTRKRNRETSVPNCKITVIYAIKGRRICRSDFAAVVQVHPVTIKIHSKSIAEDHTVTVYSPTISNRRHNIMTPRTTVLLTFLDRYGQDHGLKFPTGRGSTDERHLTRLPNDVTKDDVYTKYKLCWK